LRCQSASAACGAHALGRAEPLEWLSDKSNKRTGGVFETEWRQFTKSTLLYTLSASLVSGTTFVESITIFSTWVPAVLNACAAFSQET
jgi:hypothetical protein